MGDPFDCGNLGASRVIGHLGGRKRLNAPARFALRRSSNSTSWSLLNAGARTAI
jgi:hypothetical protein